MANDDVDGVAALAAMLVMLAAVFAVVLSIPPDANQSQEIYSLPYPSDIPLLTAEAKAEGEETGVYVFKVGEMTYVMRNLPIIYR